MTTYRHETSRVKVLTIYRSSEGARLLDCFTQSTAGDRLHMTVAYSVGLSRSLEEQVSETEGLDQLALSAEVRG